LEKWRGGGNAATREAWGGRDSDRGGGENSNNSGQEGVLNVFARFLDIFPSLGKWSLVAQFYNAAKAGKQAKVQDLLDQGVQPDLQHSWGESPLCIAFKNGHLEVVRLLLKTKAVDVNAKSKSGRPHIFGAAAHGHEEIVALLLEAKAIPGLKDEYGQTIATTSKIIANKPTSTHIPAEIARYNLRENQLSRIPREARSKVETDSVHRVKFAWLMRHSDCIILVQI
jgi:hypothetical protein